MFNPKSPTKAAGWARTTLPPSAMPKAFQGKPVATTARNHSLTPSPKASARMRPGPLLHSNRAMAKPSPVNSASTAGRPNTAKGSTQAN